MTSWKTGLVVSTSLKHSSFAGALDLLTERERHDYGRVYLIETGPQMACVIPPSVAPENARGVVENGQISVIDYETGKPICSGGPGD
jgi:hypothetical protein